MYRFIGGRSIQHAISRMSKSSFLPIYDYAKEASLDQKDALNYMKKIKKDVKVPEKPSAFALKYSSFNDDTFMLHTVHHMLPHCSMILLDAENNKLYEKEQNCYDKIINTYNTSDDFKIFKTIQCYRKDSMNTLIEDIMKYPNLGLKLTRGAYYEQDFKENVLFDNKYDTDRNYNNAIRYVLKKMKNNNIKLMIATHNDESMDLAISNFKIDKKRVYFAQLLGMNDAASYKLLEDGYKVYKYVPYGSLRETLPYFTRRLYENYDILKYV